MNWRRGSTWSPMSTLKSSSARTGSLTRTCRSVRASGFPCLLVFLLPPSWEELERRLRRRGTDPEEEIRRRLADAKRELLRQDDFDLKVTNVDAERAADEIARALG